MPASVRTTLRFLFVFLLLAVFWLALLPAPEVVKLVSWQDKIEHAVLFALLALLALAAWPERPLPIALGLLLYGAAMELAQSMTAHRFGDPWDWLADAVGLLVLVPFALRRR
ncbi:MAG TPA: VanZ family protein [Thauera sp.]|uniref:VanZ family protein n=1 Tax=Thauera sp. TaxID=1905334 RepID=UPI002D0D5B0F|nr:VanZ family protein [Thauera sp.]HRP23425.1 VanZ family protein [Thauera sp.]HRP65414.1 VanZ family protein [Thauera sp.]